LAIHFNPSPFSPRVRGEKVPKADEGVSRLNQGDADAVQIALV
jgi:hypothetical protein